MGTDLLESLEVLTHLVVEAVGEDLAEFAILDVLLSVEEPVGDLVLTRIVHDRHDPLHLGTDGRNEVSSRCTTYMGRNMPRITSGD